MPNGGNPLSGFMFAPHLNPEHFSGWSDGELATLPDKQAFGEVVTQRLEGAGASVEWAYNELHDRDTKRVWDASIGDFREAPVETHHNYVAKFSRARSGGGLTLPQISAALGYPADQIEKPKRGHSLENWLPYVVHAVDAEKFPYDPAGVATLRGTPYIDVYSANKAKWDEVRAKKTADRLGDMAPMLLMMVRTGEVTLEDILVNDELFNVYSNDSQTMNLIDAILKRNRMREEAKARKLFEAGEFEGASVFVSGRRGEGKSLLLEGIVNWAQEEFGWRAPRLSAKNAIENYAKQGGGIVLLDDVKPYAAAWEDWLHIVDPYTMFSASARYRNTDEMATHLVAVSTNFSPESFAFTAMMRDDPDFAEGQVDAFLRRPDLFVFCLNSDIFGTNHWVITRPVDSPWRPFVAKNPSKRVAGDPTHIEVFTQIAFAPVVNGLVAAPQVAWTIAELICERNGVAQERMEPLCWSAVEHVAAAMRIAYEKKEVNDVLGYEGVEMTVAPFPSQTGTTLDVTMPHGLLREPMMKRSDGDGNDEAGA